MLLFCDYICLIKLFNHCNVCICRVENEMHKEKHLIKKCNNLPEFSLLQMSGYCLTMIIFSGKEQHSKC